MNKTEQHESCILVTVSGPDQPGITSRLMEVVVKNNTQLLDMGQSVTHGLLSLSFLLGMGSSDHRDNPVIKDLLFESKEMGLALDFEVVDKDIAYPGFSDERFILNCVSTENPG